MDFVEKSILGITLIILLLLIGFTLFYTGCQTPANVLTIDDVERILENGTDLICLDDGFDKICVLPIPGPAGPDGKNASTIHITEKSIVYQFNYKGELLLIAEKQITEQPEVITTHQTSSDEHLDTQTGTDISQENRETTPVDDAPESEENNEPVDDTNDLPQQQTDLITHHVPNGWLIWIYYLDVPPDAERGLTPETSGFDISVRDADGMELKIRHFAQVDGWDGRAAVQFLVQTDSKAIIIDVEGLIHSHRATFIIEGDSVISHDGTDTFQLQPL